VRAPHFWYTTWRMTDAMRFFQLRESGVGNSSTKPRVLQPAQTGFSWCNRRGSVHLGPHHDGRHARGTLREPHERRRTTWT
jgi:hypothetical protein